MTFIDSVKICFQKYVTFSGRARRAEYWWWALFVFLVSIIASIIDLTLFGQTQVSEPGSFLRTSDIVIFYPIISLALFLPSISALVRRLHDRDKSGWWYWLVLIPLVGPIVLFIWLVSRGTTGPNRFGPDPISGEGGPLSYEDSAIPSVTRQ
ncbi:DUF805 domain-containing protein [Celeribacter ethanolicus]|uniref:DUF805 domain-containing protein n=1 Tax=Celeribacter ethanolicus TaxID=1758178 RepID=A0A291GBZ6_9RHOB|nr:DUF805 domain-containing protein [Celeribacter ethanolicus]ATG48073.1 DUF805 domain-containing protein [Celeribacter ethanolicus]